MEYGLLEKLNPLGTKKSTRYLATSKGVLTLPVIIELYLFSIESIDESILDESQMDIKSQIRKNRVLFEEKRKAEYLAFNKELSELKTE